MYTLNWSIQWYQLSITIVMPLNNVCKVGDLVWFWWDYSSGPFRMSLLHISESKLVIYWLIENGLGSDSWGNFDVLSSSTTSMDTFEWKLHSSKQRGKCVAFFKPVLQSCLLRSHRPKRATWPSPESEWESTKILPRGGLSTGKSKGWSHVSFLPQI